MFRLFITGNVIHRRYFGNFQHEVDETVDLGDGGGHTAYIGHLGKHLLTDLEPPAGGDVAVGEDAVREMIGVDLD